MTDSRKFQLVLEFHGDDPDSFERVVAVEAKLEQTLQTGEVDGNDVGLGVVNIFIITSDPSRCFDDAMCLIESAAVAPAAAGYRNLDAEAYVRLWPKGDSTPFELR